LENEAREYAIRAHGTQMYGDHPYSIHLDAVATFAKPYGDIATTIAYLHDVVEDTYISEQDIRKKFGALVAECVSILSDSPGATRKERKAKTYKKMRSVSGDVELALTVKVCDRLANVLACKADGKTSLLNVYRAEHKTFRGSAFRAGRCDELWKRLDEELLQFISGE